MLNKEQQKKSCKDRLAFTLWNHSRVPLQGPIEGSHLQVPPWDPTVSSHLKAHPRVSLQGPTYRSNLRVPPQGPTLGYHLRAPPQGPTLGPWVSGPNLRSWVPLFWYANLVMQNKKYFRYMFGKSFLLKYFNFLKFISSRQTKSFFMRY